MSILQHYKTWVRNNHNLIGAIEGGLSSLTWLLPDRFSDSELNLEALNSFLGLLGLFHESILNEPFHQKGVQQPVQWSFWLGAVQQVEVLVEMAARNQERKGTMDLYTPLAVLESLKATLRLLILQRSKDRILTDGGLTASDEAGAFHPHTTPEMRAQAVFSAFARFRAQHVSSPPRNGKHSPEHSLPSKEAQASTGAISLLHHVSAVVSEPTCANSPAQPDSAQQLSETHPPHASSSQAHGPDQSAGEAHVSPLAEESASASGASASALQASPSQQGRTLTSHPLPLSPEGSPHRAGGAPQPPFWWDSPDTTLWPEEEAQSELESESSAGHAADEKLKQLQTAAQRQQALARHLVKAGELTNICRPLAYVIALRWWGRRSWKPWGVSLAVDLLSLQLTKLGASVAEQEVDRGQASQPGLSTSSSMLLLYSLQCFRWTPIEQRELTRRKLLILFYLIRSPFFEKYTRGVANTALGLLQPIPLVGLLAGKASEILFGIQQYYTYTSAS